MKRWIIEKPEGIFKLYYKDLATANERNPTAISIKECTDYGYLEHVEKIKTSATETLLNYKGKLVYKVPHNSAHVLVQLWYDMIDGKPFYYDSLQFQNHDVIWVMPVIWEVSTPQEFCKRFLDDAPVDLPIEVISMRELKSLKPIKFWFKNFRAYYRDANGYFYFAHKRDLPGKKAREEYIKFKGNDNAVLACMLLRGQPEHKRWYSSESEFLDEYRKFQANTPASHGSTSYEIKARGFKKISPEDRKILFRLPYFRLDTELKYEKCTFHIAQKWCALMEDHNQFGDEPRFLNAEWVEDLIKRWISHNTNAPAENNGGVFDSKPEHIPKMKGDIL